MLARWPRPVKKRGGDTAGQVLRNIGHVELMFLVPEKHLNWRDKRKMQQINSCTVGIYCTAGI